MLNRIFRKNAEILLERSLLLTMVLVLMGLLATSVKAQDGTKADDEEFAKGLGFFAETFWPKVGDQQLKIKAIEKMIASYEDLYKKKKDQLKSDMVLAEKRLKKIENELTGGFFGAIMMGMDYSKRSKLTEEKYELSRIVNSNKIRLERMKERKEIIKNIKNKKSYAVLAYLYSSSNINLSEGLLAFVAQLTSNQQDVILAYEEQGFLPEAFNAAEVADVQTDFQKNVIKELLKEFKGKNIAEMLSLQEMSHLKDKNKLEFYRIFQHDKSFRPSHTRFIFSDLPIKAYAILKGHQIAVSNKTLEAFGRSAPFELLSQFTTRFPGLKINDQIVEIISSVDNSFQLAILEEIFKKTPDLIPTIKIDEIRSINTQIQVDAYKKIAELLASKGKREIPSIVQVNSMRNSIQIEIFDYVMKNGIAVNLDHLPMIQTALQKSIFEEYVKNNIPVDLVYIAQITNEFQKSFLMKDLKKHSTISIDLIKRINNANQLVAFDEIAEAFRVQDPASEVDAGKLLEKAVGFRNGTQVEALKWKIKTGAKISVHDILAIDNQTRFEYAQQVMDVAPELVDKKYLPHINAKNFNVQVDLAKMLKEENISVEESDMNVFKNVEKNEQITVIKEMAKMPDGKLRKMFARLFFDSVDKKIQLDFIMSVMKDEHLTEDEKVSLLEQIHRRLPLITSENQLSSLKEALVKGEKPNIVKIIYKSLSIKETQKADKASGGSETTDGLVCVSPAGQQVVTKKKKKTTLLSLLGFGKKEKSASQLSTDRSQSSIHGNGGLEDKAESEHSFSLAKSTEIFSPLYNLGNTCFANSSIKLFVQMINLNPDNFKYFTPEGNPLVKGKNETDEQFEERKDLQLIFSILLENIYKGTDIDVVKAINRDFFTQLQKVIDLRGETIGGKNGRLMRDQMDPEEFINKVTDLIGLDHTPMITRYSTIVKKPKSKNLLKEALTIVPFQIHEDPQEDLPEEFRDPSIGITKVKSVQEGVHKFFSKVDKVSGVIDEATNKKGPAIKGNVLTSVPETMIVQEKRYKYKDGVKSKLSSPVDVGDIQLPVYDEDFNEVGVVEMTPATVIIHDGGANGGHYYSFLKEKSGWTRHDDSRVESVGMMAKSGMHSDFKSSGYVILYAKKKYTPHTAPIKKELDEVPEEVAPVVPPKSDKDKEVGDKHKSGSVSSDSGLGIGDFGDGDDEDDLFGYHLSAPPSTKTKSAARKATTVTPGSSYFGSDGPGDYWGSYNGGFSSGFYRHDP